MNNPQDVSRETKLLSFRSNFWRKELENVISEKKISPFYQPIVNIENGIILGYEALSRGPFDSPLRSPEKLFEAAIKNQMLFDLEQVCREAALNNINNLLPNQQLFLNMNAEVVHDPHFQNGKTKKYILQRGFKPEQIVFEITERTAINDYQTFSRLIYHYRRQGYKIAVDDAGAGYSSLQSIIELRPEFIKLDMSMIRGIHANLPKQAIVEAMVKMAAAVNSEIIAEGVESREELIALHHLGVRHVQGYYLAKPNFPAPSVSPEAAWLINNLNEAEKVRRSNDKLIGLGMNIDEITEIMPVVEKGTLVRQVVEILEEKKLDGIVVVEDKKPIGLVMKNKLYYKLGSGYGVSLYRNRPVELVMDKSPLIVRSEMSLEEVSQIAASRNDETIYDLIILSENGQYAGVVSVMNLLSQVTKIQLSRAHNSNPLTGLQGNLVIEAKIKYLLERDEVFTVLYIDLDNFKAFNDKYGFEKGDKAILLTAQILGDSIAHLGCGDDFLGHIGGDDFIIITRPEYDKAIANEIIKKFDRKIRSLYDYEDLERGYIEVTNRRGEIELYPIMSISLAAVTNSKRKFNNCLEIGELAAELKKAAKKFQGSSVVFDRRIT